MRERVEVDFLTYKNSDTGFEDLKLAVAKLTTASEEQFEQIKKLMKQFSDMGRSGGKRGRGKMKLPF